MTTTPPVIGQEPWGEDLNAHLAWLAASIENNTMRIDDLATQIAGTNAGLVTLEGQLSSLAAQVGMTVAAVAENAAAIAANTTAIDALSTRLAAQETKPDYIFVNTVYMFATGAPPATGSQIRLDNADPKLATIMDIRRLDSDGADRSYALSLLNDHSQIRINDFNNAAIWHRYRVMGPTTKSGADNWYVPVAWHSGQGTLPAAKLNVGIFIDSTTVL